MRKIAEHQDKEEETEQTEAEKKTQPQVQLITMEQMTNFKLDDINAKLDCILQWIQSSKVEQKK